MAVVSPSAPDRSFETFYAAHVREFETYLSGVLGPNAEGRGGRLGIEDALQAGVLRIYGEWPKLRDADGPERDRHAFRCLRDAAGEALRTEHGRRDQGAVRPWVSAYDFGALDSGEEDVPAREREMTASVLGAMARHVTTGQGEDERAMLDRGVLLAGLRVLTEREALVLIAVDQVGWEQTALADHLGVDAGTVYESLFVARKLFYSVVRHAVGIEVDDVERARLYAYEDGLLKGKEKRIARRHVNHCQACQALTRERRVFGNKAHRVLSGLPFLLGSGVLVKKTAVKAAAALPASSGASAAGKGLFAQAGAAKALGSTVAILAVGVGAGAWLSITHAPRPPGPAPLDAGVSQLRVTAPGGPLVAPPSAKHAKAKTRKHQAPVHHTAPHKKSASHSTTSSGAASTPAASNASPPSSSVSPSTPVAPTTGSGSGSGSSSGGSSGGGGSSSPQGEFFHG